ncbi:Glutamate carboxypeptidase 2 [Seminavis robusta]|uniref:Glutamate carboxypeptidase 2 n=1 Tax=Seminavis robusta TaxID=568900 RepID=A0A9N8D9D7_9STRA|nr:Glutamate carboxypeptidase 2 [Seminavis robusta]|eukprot:Sro40_g024630.1 Glutamate carboxypeptidase 2 (742) ;mRNA; f:62865-65090
MLLPAAVGRLMAIPILFVCAIQATLGDTSHEPSSIQPKDNEVNLEKLLLSVPDHERLRESLRYITKRSHVAGTEGDWENAYYVRDRLREFGFDANIEGVEVMMTYPVDRPKVFTSEGYHAKMSEDILVEDVTSGTTQWRNHTFLAYSPSGQVTGKLVYANFGMPEDFDALGKMGVTVNGTIVIMRYGGCFRGLKVMNAEERGAIGSIIYSDPQQDGFSQGPTYPKGPWRPPSGVQRGSVQHISKCAGDPWRIYLNNSQSSNSTVKEVCGYETHDMIPKHPAVPLSYEDAMPLLEKLGGLSAPSEFQGGLAFNYTVGPSDFDVTIHTNHTFFPRTIPNVIATLTAEVSNKANTTSAVILGNHRDAWVFGAVDPNSGTTALLEVARTFQVLKQTGQWKQRRDIILASWSGEEYGLLGSTAYAELNAQESQNRVIAYLNVDCAVKGNYSLQVSATHSLAKLFREAAQQVPAPPVLASPSQQSNNTRILRRKTPVANNRSMADVTIWKDQEVLTLGSGSDYTAFLDRLGISSLDMSFLGSYGQYHSVYDSMSWMEQQGDPTFEIHQAMTRLWALLAFRLATDEKVPIHMTEQAARLVEDLQVVDTSIQEKFGNQVDTSSLDQAAMHFLNAAMAIDNEHSRLGEYATTSASQIEDINRRLSLVEREFLGPGLPKRPYYRHVLQAPGYYLGYGSQPFPGIHQAFYDGDAKLAQSEVLVAAKAVSNAASLLRGDPTSKLPMEGQRQQH